MLARGLVAGGQLLASDEALFDLAADLEGHPDNVAPAFYGGFVISGREDDHWYAVRAGVDPRITAVVFVPPTGVETTVARGLLPDSVPHADAAANSGRAALLVAALTGQPEHLLAATRDWLHQDQREPAMPETLALVRRLRADGVPAVVSGAGPDGAGVRHRRHLRPRGAVPTAGRVTTWPIEPVGRTPANLTARRSAHLPVPALWPSARAPIRLAAARRSAEATQRAKDPRDRDPLWNCPPRSPPRRPADSARCSSPT